MKKLLFTILILLFSVLRVDAQHIDVAYCIDNNYVIYTLISINSIIKNNKSKSDYTFYIFENGISDKNKKFMKRYIEKRGQKVTFINVDPLKFDKHKKLYENKYITPIALARIIIPEMLPESVHKFIYIDGDTIITSDFSEFYNLDLGNCIIGMVYDRNQHPKKRLKLEIYYNAGLILINLDKWRKENITQYLLDDLNKNYEKYLIFADQDLLNSALYKRIKSLPKCWNNQIHTYRSLINVKESKMIHYTSRNKPWKIMSLSEKCLAYRIYYEYWNYSGLRMYKYLKMIEFLKKKNHILKFKNLVNAIKYIKVIRVNNLIDCYNLLFFENVKNY